MGTQNKITLRCHIIFFRMAWIKQMAALAGKDVGEGWHLFTVTGNANLYSHMGISVAVTQ